jgi:phospholipase/carboxylesterase
MQSVLRFPMPACYKPSIMNRDSTAGGVERSIKTEIKLYYDLIPASSQPAPLLIALHGYGAGKWHATREAKAIVPDGFAIVSLQGPHQHLREPKEPGGPLRYGFGWLTNFHPGESVALHHRALREIIDRLTNERLIDARRIFLLGFSQSCALNYRFAFTHSDVLRGVMGICGGLPGDWKTNESYKKTNAAIFHLAGEHDEYYPPIRVENYATQLRTKASDVQFRSYDAGHEIVPNMRNDIRDWLEVKGT